MNHTTRRLSISISAHIPSLIYFHLLTSPSRPLLDYPAASAIPTKPQLEPSGRSCDIIGSSTDFPSRRLAVVSPILGERVLYGPPTTPGIKRAQVGNTSTCPQLPLGSTPLVGHTYAVTVLRVTSSNNHFGQLLFLPKPHLPISHRNIEFII